MSFTIGRHVFVHLRVPALLVMCLGLIASSSGAAAGPSVLSPPNLGAPPIEHVGCKLQGANLVCDGKILKNRLKRPRLKAKEQPKAAAPSASKSKPAKSQTAKTPSTKTQSSKASSSKSQAPKSGAPAPEQEVEEEEENQAASVEEEQGSEEQGNKAESSKTLAGEEGKGPVQYSCPPGHVVLEKPNAAGSHCEPVAKEAAKPAEAPKPVVPSTPPAPAISGGAPTPENKVPEASASPPPTAQAASSGGKTCCSTKAIDKSSGLALPGDGAVSLCGASEQDAKGMLSAFAELQDYMLVGDVSCEPK